LPLFLSTHSAPGLSPDEIQQNTKAVLESKHAKFKNMFVNMREGFIVTLYEGDSAEQVQREFERVGFPFNEIHEINFSADEQALRAMAGV
jgi:hypothetical protein